MLFNSRPALAAILGLIVFMVGHWNSAFGQKTYYFPDDDANETLGGLATIYSYAHSYTTGKKNFSRPKQQTS